MRRAWLTATIVTAFIAAGAWSFSQRASGRFEWGSPEIPKAQCEALGAASLATQPLNRLALVYQERVAHAVVRESQNTWSNLAFVFGGALLLAYDRRVFARFLGAALVALGVASGVYHASLLPGWRTVDVAMMGWTTAAISLLGLFSLRNHVAFLRRLLPENPATQSTLSIVAGALAITAAVFRNDVRIAGIKPFDSTYMTVVGVTFIFLLLAGSLIVVARARATARLVLLAMTVATAVICQLLDHPGLCFCRPESPLQAHAVWHGLMALAALMTYDLFALIAGAPTLWWRNPM
jgi:hypothetical protein